MKIRAVKGTSFLVLAMVLLLSCSRNFSRLYEEENRYHLTTENQLKDSAYLQKLEAFYNGGKEGFFVGKENVSIYFRIFEQPNTDKAILISSGRTEAAVKYKELIYDLYQNGYSVYIHDHRGQGQSGRMTKDPDMGYVDSFQYYIDDMKYFFDHYIKPKQYKQQYLLCHSMGGAIGITYLEQHTKDFNAAAFSSPMLGLKPPICSMVSVLNGDTPKYAIGQSKYKQDKSDFKDNTLTGSQVRFNRMIDAYAAVPQARLGGATYPWLEKSCQQFDSIFGNIDAIRTPFILFSSEKERIVHPYAHQKFISLALEKGKNCKAYEIEEAQHELFIEKDKPRIKTLNRTLDFFAKH